MAASTAIRQFLVEAQRRVRCDAVAFTSPSRDHFYSHADPKVDAKSTSEILEVSADTFLLECRNRSEPLLRNKVRYEPGGPLVGRFLIAPVHDETGSLAGIFILFRHAAGKEFDKTHAQQAAELSRSLSKVMSTPTDPLTGLFTRTGVERLVEWRLDSLGAQDCASVLYGDIDQLHVVNDLLVFEAGDRVIAAVAQALDSKLASQDAVLSRLSGDRFTVFLPGCTLAKAQQIADQLRDAVQAAPLALAEDTIPMSICFGAASASAGERSFDHALAAAEVACKAAKDRGRNRVEAYHVSDSSIIRRRDDISIVARLRAALDEGRFEIFGQPIAALLQPEETRRYEMLLRIIDEKGRLVLPGHFMSSATRYQLLPQIDRCVVTHVLSKLKQASERPGFVPLHTSINLSGPTISEAAFLEWLPAEIERHGVPGDWLTFELTETAAVKNLEQAQRLMQRLGEQGCRFALDDFGTGLSSLAHLKSMNFSTLKIDGSFIRDILHNDRSESLVRAVGQLAGAMGMETVAEYVETPEICMRLIELEVQFGQGYAIGKPRPLDRILELAPDLAHAS